MPFAAYYLQVKALAQDPGDGNYFTRTIRHVTDRIMEYINLDLNPAEGNDNEKQRKEQRQRQQEDISLTLARAAVIRNAYELSPGSEVKLFMKDSSDQAIDAPEHLLSAAAILGNLSLVKHLVEKECINAESGSDVFGDTLANAGRRGYVEIAQFLLSKGVK